MSDYKNATLPSIAISRTKRDISFDHNLSFNLGDLHVLGISEVLPGSTHKIELGSLIRMSTPIAPIMSDIVYEVFAFFVPQRLTWDHTKQFHGESDAAGLPQTSYTIPMKQGVVGSYIDTVADDFGIAPNNLNNPLSFECSVLPFRGFGLIYNRFFRNQNVEAPLSIYTGDLGYITNDEATTPGTDAALFGLKDSTTPVSTPARMVAYKKPDYVTSCLPYAQKGDPVKIPGTNAMVPVITGDEHTTGAAGGVLMRKASDGSIPTGTHVLGMSQGVGNNYLSYTSTPDQSGSFTGNSLSLTNLWANMAVQTANTINDLRFAFQLQKALERDALYGSRYWEVLRAHYAVTSPDASLQDPQLIGAAKFDININQVLQTTGFVSASNTNLGTPGANSVTAHRDYLMTSSFTEHGYLYIIGVARQRTHIYSNIVPKMFSRKNRFDFYYPVFANIGCMKVLQKEVGIPAASSGQTPESVFGFQSAWNDYRFHQSYNSGLLNPYREGALDYWTLADKSSGLVTLSKQFLKEDRSNLARALVTGSAGPDFIGSFYIKDICVDPMPLDSIPGFADHH